MILVVIVILIILVVLSKVKAIINFENYKLSVILIIFGVIKIKLKAKTSMDNVEKASHEISNKINIRAVLKLAGNNKSIIQYIMSRLKLRLELNCSYFVLSVDKTAILYGVINAILYSLHSLLMKYLKKYEGKYNIIPDFNNGCNRIELKAVFSMRIIHIISFIIRLVPKLIQYRKIIFNKGGDNNESSNRGLDENYNG